MAPRSKLFPVILKFRRRFVAQFEEAENSKQLPCLKKVLSCFITRFLISPISIGIQIGKTFLSFGYSSDIKPEN